MFRWKKTVMRATAGVFACLIVILCPLLYVYAEPGDAESEDVSGGIGNEDGDMSEVTGDEDKPEWDGWDEESIDDVYSVFANTSWEYLPYLVITSDSSYTKFDDMEEQVREDLMDSGIIKLALGSYDHQLGKYPNECYAELVLGIIEEFCHLKGMYSETDTDVGFNYVYSYQSYDNEVSDETERRKKRIESVKRLFQTLISRETEYEKTFDEGVDLYASDERLASVLQGIVYGIGYTKTYENSTKKTAKEYYKENKDTKLSLYEHIDGMYDFADDIIEHYSAVKAVGTITNYE